MSMWSRTLAALCLVGAGVSAAAQPPAVPANLRLLSGSNIAVAPGESIQDKVAAAPAGTTFVIKSGVHRLQSISPKAGDVFNGEAGTILSGARVLSSWTQAGPTWYASGQTQEGATRGVCANGFPRCDHPEELFIDDVRQLHVATLDAVKAGTWYFDYGADRIHVGVNPSEHTVETSVTAYAVMPTANSVVFHGITVEKYAVPAQYGPINGEGAFGWVVSDNVIRWNHGGGIRIGNGMRALRNNVHHNGQIGISGVGADVLVEGNEIAYNNEAGFEIGWEAGGTKFVLTTNLIVRGNNVHHNRGPGLWTDINNLSTTYESNTVEDNTYMGILHEVSYAAVIRNNTVRRNGFGYSDWIWGAGILVAASPNVEIYGNTLEGNADGIGAVQQNRGSEAAPHGAHEISNLNVHDNNVTMAQGWTGMVQDVGDSSYFTSRNNRFTSNTYHLSTATATLFAWGNAELTKTQWVAAGQDVAGVFLTPVRAGIRRR